MTTPIPLEDLATVTAGNFDYVIVVDATSGAARKALLPTASQAATDLSAQISTIISDAQAEADALVADAQADIAAAVAGIGYEPPVAYASGINLTSTRETVEYDGEVYAPLASALPFTTSGTFEAASFRLIQGVAFSDLAASSGANMVGFQQAGTGAVARTMQDKARERISLFDFIPTNQKAAIRDRTSTYDATLGLLDAIAECETEGRGLLVPSGLFLYSGGLVISKSIDIEGESKWLSELRCTDALADHFSMVLTSAEYDAAVRIAKLRLQGGRDGFEWSSGTYPRNKGLNLESLYFEALSGKCLNLARGTYGMTFEDLHGESCEYGVYAVGDSLLNATKFHRCRFASMTECGAYMEEVGTQETAAVTFDGCLFEGNQKQAVVAKGVHVNLNGCWMESNGRGGDGAATIYPDVSVASVGALAGRVNINGGAISTAHANQASIRIRAESTFCRITMSGVNMAGSNKIDMGGFLSTSLTLIGSTPAAPTVINTTNTAVSSLGGSGMDIDGGTFSVGADTLAGKMVVASIQKFTVSITGPIVIAAGSTSVQTKALSDATVPAGALVFVVPSGIGAVSADIAWSASVITAGSVRIVLANHTGSDVTVNTKDWHVFVIR